MQFNIILLCPKLPAWGFFMAKENSIFDPKDLISKVLDIKKKIWVILSKRKSLTVGILVIIVALVIYNKTLLRKDTAGSAGAVKITTVKIDKGFEFPALNSQGKSVKDKIRLKIITAEKTNQVLVNDKSFTAKNQKLFLILNLELKNDATQPLNIIPGDLIRIAYKGDEENKFAPDLHNNMVPVAAISTKIDRVGFVIPETIREITISIGELEGKKETVEISFPS